MHALKIEDLRLTVAQADRIETVMDDFLEQLGYKADQIEAIDCRERSGFWPFHDNKGGKFGITWLQADPHRKTGFEKTDQAIVRIYKSFCDDYNTRNGANAAIDDEGLEDEWRSAGFEVLLETQIVLNGDRRLQVRLMSCASDAPYYTKFDDIIEIDILFNNIGMLRAILQKVLTRPDVKKFSALVDAWY